MTDHDIAADLTAAGLQFIERLTIEFADLLPPLESPASCHPTEHNHGRFDSSPDKTAQVDDPDGTAKINAGWWQMADEFGLLDESREFALAVDVSDMGSVESEYVWVRVRLAETWDIAGSGSAVLRGWFGTHFTDRYLPEFTMHSLDQKMLLQTAIWGDGSVSTIVIRPDRAAQSGR
ncbi:hypothetical protein [Kineosporia babensis]